MMKVIILGLLLLSISGFCQTPVDSLGALRIGGIEQVVNVQGKDNSKPLLLFLHGGPGGSVISYADKFTRRLQEHFIVVQWDQRQTGKTLERNASPEPLTVKLFQDDTHALVDSLLKKFKQRKLYVIGHSWGTVLGFYIAKKFPEKIYAYVAVGPMINQLESERMSLEMLKKKATETKNETMLKELSNVNIPFEDGEQLFYHRKWLLNSSGSKTKLSKDYVERWAGTWLNVYNEASKNNLVESLPVINCPVYFFAGRKDHQTSSAITEAYFHKLNAPKKNLFWFERSAHGVPTTEPELFQRIIIETILPETLNR
jgi:pimeloyl-ACP methyl ester carboxylesterase